MAAKSNEKAAETTVAENVTTETTATEPAKKLKKYKITVTTNPDFCGVDAGGVQFAHGAAIISEGTMVEWFREHEGYSVDEVTE